MRKLNNGICSFFTFRLRNESHIVTRFIEIKSHLLRLFPSACLGAFVSRKQHCLMSILLMEDNGTRVIHNGFEKGVFAFPILYLIEALFDIC